MNIPTLNSRFHNTTSKLRAGALAAVLSVLCMNPLSAAAAEDPSTPPERKADTTATKAFQTMDDLATAAGLNEAKPPTTQSPGDASPGKPTKIPKEKSDHEKLMEVMSLSLGIIATVMGIGVALLAIWCDSRKRSNLIAACHQERMAALEKGLELPPFPPELMSGEADSASCAPCSGLKSGLMWLAIGIGLWLFLSPKNHGLLHPSIGAIPAAIGLAYLVYYVLEGRKRTSGQSASRG